MDSLASDWKLFNKYLPTWRENYLEKINRHIIEVFTNDKLSNTEKFWKVKKVMDDKEKILTDCFDNYSRSNMFIHIVMMCNNKVIGKADLSEFSSTVTDQIDKMEEIKITK